MEYYTVNGKPAIVFKPGDKVKVFTDGIPEEKEITDIGDTAIQLLEKAGILLGWMGNIE